MSAPTVATTRGEIETARLGATLMHEHVLVLTAEVAKDYPDLSWSEDRARIEQEVVTKLRAIKDAGIDSIVDLTAFGHGRDMATLQRLAARVELNILVATGIYTFDHLPLFFQLRPPELTEGRRTDVLIDMFVRDVRAGIAGTGIRAAIIKCATDRPGVTPNVDRCLRAAAIAHRETGAPISTHSLVAARNGLDQQRIFREEGVDLSRVVIGHSGDSTDLGYLRALMDEGSTIGSDRFGLYLPERPGMEERIITIARLCEEGYSDRIVLSHDASCYTDWSPPGSRLTLQPQWVQTHISTDVLPAMRKRGIAEEHIMEMLVGNPRRIFEGQGPY